MAKGVVVGYSDTKKLRTAVSYTYLNREPGKPEL
jgi:hypothetical protein